MTVKGHQIVLPRTRVGWNVDCVDGRKCYETTPQSPGAGVNGLQEGVVALMIRTGRCWE